jgi:hypothetical protein
MQVRSRKGYEVLHFYETGTTGRAPLSLKGVTPSPNPVGIPYPAPRVRYIISAFRSSCIRILLFSLSSVASMSTIFNTTAISH